jgi:hypothetical protein
MSNFENKFIDKATRILSEKSTKTSGQFQIQHIQDVDVTAEQCKLDRKDNESGFSHNRTMRKVGSIPLVFAMQPKYKDLLDGDQKAMAKASKRFFEDHPEFRTCNGNI